MAQDEQSLVHREMARRSQDIHRVKNPTDTDFKLIWDGYVEIIPANGTADLETFKVDKYLREMTDLILIDRQNEAVKEQNEVRAKRGENEMEKWLGEAQHVFEGKFATIKGVGNPEVRMKIYKELYIGLVKEYGVERYQKEKVEATPSTHEQLMNKILGSKIPETDSKPPIVEKLEDTTSETPLEQLNQPQLRKMAKKKGIKTKKTDKKAELIEKISE